MSTALAPKPITSTGTDPSPRRWTRDEFYRMAELGWFHAELIDGEIMVLSPRDPSHS